MLAVSGFGGTAWSAGAAVSAEEVAEQVAAALGKAEATASSRIDVVSHAGSIVISGKVPSPIVRTRAIEIAEGAAQGLRVIEMLQVQAPAPTAAETASLRLVRRVEQALQTSPLTAQLGIFVSIDESGVIGLHGLVPSPENRKVAGEVAAKVEGVGRINNHLVIPGED